MKFIDALDTVQTFSRASVEGHGEDSFYSANTESTAIISVFDGSGGSGAMTYDIFSGHTGAYVASRALSGTLREWYMETSRSPVTDKNQIIAGIDSYFRSGFRVCSSLGTSNMRIRSTMIRDFPTTAAGAYAYVKDDRIHVTIFWAGDSRVYLLNSRGLRQLTEDDAYGDAMETLQNNPPMTNVLSSDGNYVLHSKTFAVTSPMMIFAATDGCFGYVHTPMHFEYMVLQSICASSSPVQFNAMLDSAMHSVAGDDYTFSYMSFLYGNYDNLKADMNVRLQFMEQNYMIPLSTRRNDAAYINALWQIYRKDYEAYLNRSAS
ncbi:MAG: protein phosphatase 2C domain-containing protein [Solobacterium sp.]|nr:protein phosphatase 2C domain-containing protein [Solobacterium sp.]